MLEKGKQFKAVVLAVWMVMLTMFTMIFGAVPMRGLRLVLGRIPFCLLQLGLVIFFLGMGWKALAVTLLILSILVGSYREWELKGFNYFHSGVLSLGVSSLAIALGFWAWTKTLDQSWIEVIRALANDSLAQLEKAGLVLGVQLSVDQLILQIPSAIIIGLIFSLFLSLVFESKLLLWMGVVEKKRQYLLDFRLPDFLIWVFVVSMAGSYIDFGVSAFKGISLNVFNVTLMVFFLQGMAVIQYFLKAFKAGLLLKVLVIFMVFGQPLGMIGISVVGVVDFWAEFRLRYKKKTQLKLN